VLSTVHRQCPLRSSVPPCSLLSVLSNISVRSVPPYLRALHPQRPVPAPFLRGSECCPPSAHVEFLRASGSAVHRQCPLRSSVTYSAVHRQCLLRSSVLRVLSTVCVRCAPSFLGSSVPQSAVHRQYPFRSSVPSTVSVHSVSARRVPPCLGALSTISAPRCVPPSECQYPLRSSVSRSAVHRRYPPLRSSVPQKVSARCVPPCLRAFSTVSGRSVSPCLRALSTVSARAAFLRASEHCPPSVPDLFLRASERCK